MQSTFLDRVTLGTAEDSTAQLDRVCDGKSRRFVQLKFPDCVTLGTAEDSTAQFPSDCSVCCVLKGEAQFVHSFNAVNITWRGDWVEGFSSRVY